MSFKVVSTTELPQVAFQYVPQEVTDENPFEDLPVLGGILSDLKHIWHAKGPCLEVRNIVTGQKVGSWTFGGILRDSNTKILAVDDLKRAHGRVPLLIVALHCSLSGGLVCVFDIFGSKVLRVIQVGEQITTIHVVHSGADISNLPDSSPLKYFDGILGIGTLGGNVYLLDICKQICENAILNENVNIRDEVSPCQMVILKKEKISKIKKYAERSVDNEEHLAIHLNVIVNPSTEHFTLIGEEGEDRVHVNQAEVEVSALHYSPQIASLLVGFNFGAFQLWNLSTLELLYTSPICEGNIPVTHFTVQEPADDPKAYCYIWVSYSHNLLYHSGLPFAVMYSFYFDNKKVVNGYGTLYEDFQHCSIRFQLELGDTQSSTCKARLKGGTCLGLQSINKCPTNKDLNSLALCLITWLIWDSDREVNTAFLLFDLNQWYKEQMPRMPNWSHCSNYIIKNSISEKLLDVKMDPKSLSQFIGIQRLEVHFCPTSLSFDLLGISEDTIFKTHNKGVQKTFLDKIVNDQHLALIRPEDYFEQIVSLGLMPLFCDAQLNNSLNVDYQREILLSVMLEQKLIFWLYQATTKLANNAFGASGLSIYNVLNWAFQRAVTLKNSCDKYCVPLFDYSGMRLDDNTVTLISSGTNQIRSLCSFYQYVSSRLLNFVPDEESLLEKQRSLENVVVYFEVLLWMVNIGLLPEFQPRSSVDSLLSAPYLVQDLTQYYNKKRAQLQLASRETFVEKDSLLYIDNMINNCKGGADSLRKMWQEDGGSGLYPPPSLQSVLRTYFLDGPSLIFKHSLVTYVLLDIAMSVDEHNKVIKLLLKFPQIFGITQSNIKITHAFWHLDHDDYERALESILDQCILLDDLNHWHHSVMMRSLLLQGQANLALYYFQVRKPSIQNEKDLLTVISLLVSKNMLDEAFKFRLQHKGPNEAALLTHIFNECNKNELLHSLLYRNLNTEEEKAFFNYLRNTRSPRCEDLQVFYYLLRSRFLEAFDTYSSKKRMQPDTKGLKGQRDASVADNVVKMFKTLLPDVNRNLLEVVRKERTNLWREMQKPTPLSVFVHDSRDQVHYKSSVIFAALAKAKQTFNDTLNDTKYKNEIATEDTPFLRTPSLSRNRSCVETPLLRPKVIEQNEQGDDYSPSPCKKLKLSPRASKATPMKSNLSMSIIQSKLNTPIIKRKRQSLETSKITAALPQSILKTPSRPILDDSVFDENNTSVNTSLQLECENSIRRSRLGLTPRKSVRTPLKSHVKFDDLRYSGSSLEQSSKNDSTLTVNLSSQSRNSTESNMDEKFYSPDQSIDVSAPKTVDKSTTDLVNDEPIRKSISLSKERLTFDETVFTGDVEMKDQPPANNEDNTSKPKIIVEDYDLSSNRMNFQSPKSRRSYKRSFGETTTPVRSSPRLAKKTLDGLTDDLNTNRESSESTPNESESLPPSPSVAVQKLRGRRSLSRSVLEHNAFSLLKSKSVSEDSKDYGRKSALSSLNTTLSDTDTDLDANNSFDASLEALLEMRKDLSFGTDSSFDRSGNEPLGEGKMEESGNVEVVSKVKEVLNVETRRESLRRRDTGVLVSSHETKEERYSKTFEIFGEGNFENRRNESGTIKNVSNSEIGRVGENLDLNSSKRFDEEARELSKKEKSVLQSNTSREIDSKGEEINVYDDLSSGSEDIKEVLQEIHHNSHEKAQCDMSCSTSFYQTEKKEQEMPDNIMESGESSQSDAPQQAIDDNEVKSGDSIIEEPPETEKAFIDTGEVIEIGSSSSENDSQDACVRYSQDNSNDGSNSTALDSSSNDKTYSSNDSVRGSNVSNDSYKMDDDFVDNLNDEELQQACVAAENDDVFDENESTQEAPSKFGVSIHEPRYTPTSLIDEQEENPLTSIREEAEAAQIVVDSSSCDSVQEVIAEGGFKEIESDEEHMDSLLLDEKADEQAVAIVEAQSDEVCSKVSEAQGQQNLENEAEVTVTLKPPKMQNISLQCTLGVTKLGIECDEEQTSGETSEEKSISPETHSVSLQCTLSQPEGSPSKDDSVLVPEQEASDGTPLVLRTVKRTYKGSKKARSLDVDATPKLAVDLTKRTYSRKKGNIFEAGDDDNSDHSESVNEINQKESVPVDKTEAVEDQKMETDPEKEQDKSDPKTSTDSQEKDNNKKENIEENEAKMEISEGVQGESSVANKEIENAESQQKDPIGKLTEDKQAQDPEVTPGDSPQTSEATKKYENEHAEAQQKDPAAKQDEVEAQDHASESTPDEPSEADKASKKDGNENAESQQESPVQKSKKKDRDTKAEAQAPKATPDESSEADKSSKTDESEKEPIKLETTPGRMTRRRSMLLTQQEGTASSLSEGSVTSGASKSVNDHTETSTQSSDQSSQSTKKCGRRRVLSESMFDNTMLAATPEKRDIMDSSILGDISKNKESSSVRGSYKIYTKRLSKTSKSTASAAQKLDASVELAKKTVPAKRTRSYSVDQPLTSVRGKSVRSKSVDLDDAKVTRSDGKIDLKVMLTPVSEVPIASTSKDTSQETSKPRSKASSHLGDYTTSRRLTRRQAKMLETIGEAEKAIKKIPVVEEIDPLHLLDKSEFEGSPDPDEVKIYEPNSPSNSSGTLSRHIRSASVISEVSSTPSKKGSGIKSRLRRHNTDTISEASEQSDSPSPPKRLKKKETEHETSSVKSAQKSRSRTTSVSSTKSAASDKTDTSLRAKRGRRLNSAKNELPGIQEENGSDEGDSANTTLVKKRSRKKKE